MEVLTQTCNAWIAGAKTLVITIPKTISDTLGIVNGDIVEVSFRKVTREKKDSPPIEDVARKPHLRIRNNN